jgi:signal transduction histidine kinase
VPPASLQRLNAMRSHVDAALEMTRRIAGDLRPLVLDDLGLVAALKWLLAQARSRCELEVRLVVAGDPGILCVELATALFRIAQECVTNVLRHAQATQVEIALEVGADGVELRVADDGRGLAQPGGPRRGLGLLGIEERARLLGGSATIADRSGGGTAVEVRLPLIRRAEAGRSEVAGT